MAIIPYFRNIVACRFVCGLVAKPGDKRKMDKTMRRRGFFGKLNLDFLGMSASLLCAVHCSVLPLLLTVGLLGGFSWLEHPAVEITFIFSSLMLAWLSLLPGWRRGHGRIEPVLTMLVGFGLIVLAHVFHEQYEGLLMTLGGLAIAVAHFLNWRLSKKFGCLLSSS
jgi:hypothetical protein